MKWYRAFTLFMSLLVVLQISTLIFLGENELIKSVQVKSKEFLPSRPFRLRVVYCNCQQAVETETDQLNDIYSIPYENTSPLSNAAKLTFINAYSEQFDSVSFATTPDIFEQGVFDYLDVEYSLCFFHKYFLMVHVPEAIYLYDKRSNDGFVTSRSTIYVWILFRWVEINSENWGSS